MNNIEELKKAGLVVLELTEIKGCWQSSLLETKDRGAVHAIVTERGDNICEATGNTVIDSVIIDYIEAANPAAILTLIAQLEAAQKLISEDSKLQYIRRLEAEIADWRSVAEAAAQDDADWHKLVDSKNDVISLLASGIINLKAQMEAAQKERDDLREKVNKADNEWHRMVDRILAVGKRAEKAEAELSAANERLSKPVVLPDDGLEDCINMWPDNWRNDFDTGYNFGIWRCEQNIKAAGFMVEGE